ncbi:MAG: hypothetical protein U0132_23290 [Gemmatimonadaceae bacterium]
MRSMTREWVGAGLILAGMMACADAPSAPRTPGPDAAISADEGASISAFVPLNLGVIPGRNNSVANGNNINGDAGGVSYNVDPVTDGRVTVWPVGGGPVDLGVPAGYTAAVGNAISDFNAVVGSAYNAAGRRGFVWQVGGIGFNVLLGPAGTTDLDARDIEDNNLVVVGEFTNAGNVHAFRWQLATGYQDLHPAGYLSSHAEAIGPNGDITGWAKMFGGPEHAVMWSAAGGFVDLGALPGGTDSHGFDINRFRTTVGESTTGAGTVVAIARRPPGAMQGAPAAGSRGMGISDLNRMVGWAPLGANRRAVTKRGPGGFIYLPFLGGTLNSDAREVNLCGEAVGSTTFINGSVRATRWQNIPCD